MSDPADPQVLELAVLADAGERDPVVDLADLVERGARVLRDEQHAVLVLETDDRLAPGDALVREIGQVLDPLLGWHVRHEAHAPHLPHDASGARRAARPLSTLSAPVAVTTTTVGKIPRVGSGPPVPASSCEASTRASIATCSASARSRPGRQRFFSELLAGPAARSRGVVVVLLPPAARGVVVEDPALVAALVEPAEQRHHDEPLDRHRQVPADHLREPVRLALEREPVAGDLLVVLELELEQLDDLDGLPGGAGDRDHREVVGREDLLHRLVGDREALGRPPVPAEDHPGRELERHDGRPVRRRDVGADAGGDGRVSGRLRRTRSKKLGFAPIGPPEGSGGNSGPSVIRRPSGRTT